MAPGSGMPTARPAGFLQDVGLARPPSQAFTEAAAPEVEISNERLDMVDGDEVFYFSYASTDPEVLGKENAVIEGLEENPLWQALSGVSSGHAYEVGGHWWRAQTYLLANKVIDDLFTHQVGEPERYACLDFRVRLPSDKHSDKDSENRARFASLSALAPARCRAGATNV